MRNLKPVFAFIALTITSNASTYIGVNAGGKIGSLYLENKYKGDDNKIIAGIDKEYVATKFNTDIQNRWNIHLSLLYYAPIPFVLLGILNEGGYSSSPVISSDTILNPASELNSTFEFHSSGVSSNHFLIVGIKLGIFRGGVLAGVHGQNYHVNQYFNKDFKDEKGNQFYENVRTPATMTREWTWTKILGFILQVRMPWSLIEARYTYDMGRLVSDWAIDDKDPTAVTLKKATLTVRPAGHNFSVGAYFRVG